MVCMIKGNKRKIIYKHNNLSDGALVKALKFKTNNFFLLLVLH